jgi:putative DNA primase/helicase
VAYLQRSAGLCLTGLTREQHLTFIHGPGGAGKGTYLNTLAALLGTYAHRMAIESLTEQAQAQHTEDMAALVGKRLVIASETEQGKRWAESRVKMLTGEDVVRARFMHANSFEFTPVLKLVIMGNYPPGLRSVGNDFKRRLHIVPFTRIPERPDRDLKVKLWAERDGILHWALQGCLAYLRDGLNPPAAVIKATEGYFEGQDVIAQWIDDSLEVGKEYESGVGALYRSYCTFCEKTGNFRLRQGELREALLTRGFERGGYARNSTIKGLRLPDKDPAGYHGMD